MKKFIRKLKIKKAIWGLILCQILIFAEIALWADEISGNKHYQNGARYYESGQYIRAISELEEAIKENPSLAKAHFILGEIWARNYNESSHRQHKFRERAIYEFNKVIEIEPDNGEAYEKLGGIYFYWDKDYNRAILNYKKAVESEPDNADFRSSLGKAYKIKGEIERAILEYEKVIKLTPNKVWGFLDLASCYGEVNRVDDAIKTFKKAVEVDPYCIFGRFRFADYYTKISRVNEAIAEYKKILAINPDNIHMFAPGYFVKTHEGLRELYIKSGEMLLARKELEEVKKWKKIEEEVIRKNEAWERKRALISQIKILLFKLLLIISFSLIFGFVYFYQKRRIKLKEKKYINITWGLKDVLKLLFLSYILMTIFYILIGELFYSNLGNLVFRDKGGLIKDAIHCSILIILIIFYVIIKKKQHLKDIGLTLENWLRNTFLGLGFSILFLIGIGIVEGILYALSNFNPLFVADNSVKELIMSAGTFKHLIFPIFMGSLLVPLSEELFYRGFLYPAIKKSLGIGWGISLSAIFFAAAHFDILRFIPYVILGLGLAYLYERTRSLIPTIIIHSFFNTIATLIWIIM